MEIEQKLMRQVLLNREQSISHLAYEQENAFFKSIQDGDVTEMRRLSKPFEIDSMGRLSEDPLRNLKYHLISTIALITRACIEGGMEMEEAYNLSDIYIRSIDRCCEQDEVRMLHRCSFGPLELDPALPEGEWRELTDGELKALRQAACMEDRTEKA